MQTFKMLRKHGIGFPFPFNENLANLEDMVVVEMTAAEVRTAAVGNIVIPKSVEQIDTPDVGLKTMPTEKPGPGWVLRGNKWVRKSTQKASKPRIAETGNAPAQEA